MECQHCGKFGKADDRLGDWWDFNGGHLCVECTNKNFGRDSKPKSNRNPEDASYAELRERLIAIKKRAAEREKRFKEEYPKFVDTHEQPTTEREYGAFWALDELYWIQDYCDGLIDEDDE